MFQLSFIERLPDTPKFKSTLAMFTMFAMFIAFTMFTMFDPLVRHVLQFTVFACSPSRSPCSPHPPPSRSPCCSHSVHFWHSPHSAFSTLPLESPESRHVGLVDKHLYRAKCANRLFMRLPDTLPRDCIGLMLKHTISPLSPIHFIGWVCTVSPVENQSGR